MLQNFKKNKIIYGSSLTFGTIVGAGMFSLPIASVHAWSFGAIILLAFTWIIMLISGLMLLETSAHFPIGTSFHTLVRATLGPYWNYINNIAMFFCGYILIYAYISYGSCLLESFFYFPMGTPKCISVLMFTALLSFFIWYSIDWVGKTSFILLTGMIVSFSILLIFLSQNTSLDNLFLINEPSKKIYPEVTSLLPIIAFFLCSFGFHQIVPSLVIKFKSNTGQIRSSLIFGTFGALLFYGIWLVMVFGNLSFSDIERISSQGGNVDILLKHLFTEKPTLLVSGALTLFSSLTIISSFLGVGAGMFDFIADLRCARNDPTSRLTTICCVMVPPAVCCMIAPDGFIQAIGYAGLCATIWATITPALCLRVCRKKFMYSKNSYQLNWGMMWFYIVMIFGILNIKYFIFG